MRFSNIQNTSRRKQRAASMIEVIVAIGMTAIMGLAIASSSIHALRNHKYTEIGNLARNLAVSRVEELAGVPTDTLNSSFNSTENNLVIPGINLVFRRVTTITVNADQSREINVLVTVQDNRYSKFNLNYSTTFAIWE